MVDHETLLVTYRAVSRRAARAPQEGPDLGGARRLHRLQGLRRRVPDGHRHSRRLAARMHPVRAVHRRLQRHHGQGRPAARADRLRHHRRAGGGDEGRRGTRCSSCAPRTLLYAGLICLVGAHHAGRARSSARRSRSTCCTTAIRLTSCCPTAASATATRSRSSTSCTSRASSRLAVRGPARRAARHRRHGRRDAKIGVDDRRSARAPRVRHRAAPPSWPRWRAGRRRSRWWSATSRPARHRTHHATSRSRSRAGEQPMSRDDLASATSAGPAPAATCSGSSSRFFGTVFAVNGAMIYAAVSTYSGVVANEPYRKGLHYNERIAADERQARLGWTESARDRPRRSCARSTLSDADGRPVRGLERRGRARPPVDQPARHQARSLVETAPGHYEAQHAPLAEGELAAHRSKRARAARPPSRLPHAEAPMAQALTQPACLRGHRPDAARQRRHAAGRRPTLAVENMHCGGCMRKVETALAAVPGVVSARANLSAKTRHRRASRDRASTASTSWTRSHRAGFRAAELAATTADAERKARRPRFAEAARRRRVRRRQHHAAVGVGVVGRRRRHDALGAGAVPLALGADRPAGRRLCRPAVLPLRRAGAARAPPQHGRADLARRHAGHGDEPLPDDARQRAGLLRCRRHAAVLPAGRSLSSTSACARAPRAPPPISSACAATTATVIQLRRHHRARSRARLLEPRHAHPHRRRASASPSTAACSTAAARSTRA